MQPVLPRSSSHTLPQLLYRRALKGSLDWSALPSPPPPSSPTPPLPPPHSPLTSPCSRRYVRRDIWRPKAIEIRAQFERNRDVRDPRAVAALLNEAEKEVAKYSHPDPYRRTSFFLLCCTSDEAELTRFLLDFL